MILLFEIAGWSLIVLALVHAGFPRRFRWRQQLAGCDLLTRQMFYVHTFFIALMVALMGLLCILAAEDLMGTRLGRLCCLGMAIFWGARLFIQFIGYSPQLWRGKVFETAMHICFAVYWALLTLFFVAASFHGE
ncbi:MAG: hypothetical protein EA402_09555 [Planctomycetota bacterium]|nr:MAG: hypothetical protein EA402_09555 [Planctomycetota bacterium]